jgi:outer membrane protein
MKKTISILAVALLTLSINAQKLGHLNSQAIMLELPEYESAKMELESYKMELTKELEMFQKLIMEFAQDYEKIKTDMTPEARQRKEADLMERQQNYEKKAYEAEGKLQQKEQELLQSIMLKVSNAVKAVSEKGKFDYVFDVTSLLYAGGEDISNQVKTELGISSK